MTSQEPVKAPTRSCFSMCQRLIGFASSQNKQHCPGTKNSFPLNRRRWLGGDIINDAVNMAHLVYDSNGDAVEDLEGDSGPIGGHEVGGGDASKGEGIVIGSAVAHHAD